MSDTNKTIIDRDDLNKTDAEMTVEYNAARAAEDAAAKIAEYVAREPNIRFVGREIVKGEKVAAEAPSSIASPGKTIVLPSDAQQKAGFYHPEAAEIIRMFPDRYKAFVKKGE